MTFQQAALLVSAVHLLLVATPVVVATKRRSVPAVLRWSIATAAMVTVLASWMYLMAPQSADDGHVCLDGPLTGLTIDSGDGPDAACLARNRAAVAGSTAGSAAVVAAAVGITELLSRRRARVAKP